MRKPIKTPKNSILLETEKPWSKPLKTTKTILEMMRHTIAYTMVCKILKSVHNQRRYKRKTSTMFCLKMDNFSGRPKTTSYSTAYNSKTKIDRVNLQSGPDSQ